MASQAHLEPTRNYAAAAASLLLSQSLPGTGPPALHNLGAAGFELRLANQPGTEPLAGFNCWAAPMSITTRPAVVTAGLSTDIRKITLWWLSIHQSARVYHDERRSLLGERKHSKRIEAELQSLAVEGNIRQIHRRSSCHCDNMQPSRSVQPSKCKLVRQ